MTIILHAQTMLTGRVMTFDSVKVSNAIVILRSVSDSTIRYETSTDSEGRFSFIVTDVEKETQQPASIVLHRNYPNPFFDLTTIRYELEKASNVRLDIYDVFGRHVRRLISAQQCAGMYMETWDGKNEMGEKVKQGVYFYTLSTDRVKATKKLLFGFDDGWRMIGKSAVLDRRMDNKFHKAKLSGDYYVDVIDTTTSLPRFEMRKNISLSFVKDTSIVIQVHLKSYGRWTFIGYDELYEPLKVYGDYLYGITKNGILRQNIRGVLSDRKLFTKEEFAGNQAPRISMINDYLITERGGDSILILIDPDNTFDLVLFRTTDDGQTWKSIDSGINTGNVERLLSLSDKIMCMGSSTGMKTSTNFGLSWFTVSTPRPGGFAFAFEKSPTNDRNICVAGKTFAIDYLWFAVSQDGGSTWESISKILPDSVYGLYKSGNISKSVSFDIYDSIIYMSAREDVRRLMLNSNSFIQISTFGGGKLLANPKVSGHVLYFTNGQGLYESYDYGETWKHVKGPYPINGRYSNLAYDPQEHTIYIAFEFGIWRYKL